MSLLVVQWDTSSGSEKYPGAAQRRVPGRKVDAWSNPARRVFLQRERHNQNQSVLRCTHHREVHCSAIHVRNRRRGASFRPTEVRSPCTIESECTVYAVIHRRFVAISGIHEDTREVFPSLPNPDTMPKNGTMSG